MLYLICGGVVNGLVYAIQRHTYISNPYHHLHHHYSYLEGKNNIRHSREIRRGQGHIPGGEFDPRQVLEKGAELVRESRGEVGVGGARVDNRA